MTDFSKAAWRKSAGSGGGNDCVEVAGLPDVVAVRDSKDPAGPKLAFTRTQWQEFVGQLRGGRHQL